jgi:peptidoglycan-N-acetylglucosamine deacetylase
MADFQFITVALSGALLGITLLKLILFLNFSVRHYARHKHNHSRIANGSPLVSIIIPCYNEELTLTNCVNSILSQTYGYYEIIIINDGSTDETLKLARNFARQHPNIFAYTKKNGGKATALNRGLKRAHGDIIVSIDADSILLKTALRELILSFDDPEVMAVGGNVRVANRKNPLSAHQALEYIIGLTVQRRAFAYLGCMQVISGAIGAFRKEALLEVSGYSKDTIVEDMDLTIELAKRGKKIIYNPHAIAYTEAPETMRDFLKQRYRWTYGGFQVIEKHKDILFRRHLSRMGLVGLPYFLIFPWFDVLVSVLFFVALARVAVTNEGYDAFGFMFIMIAVNVAIVIYAVIVEKERKRLAFLAVIEGLFYNHLLSFTTLRAGIKYVLRQKTQWNKVKRYGKNLAPKEVTS